MFKVWHEEKRPLSRFVCFRDDCKVRVDEIKMYYVLKNILGTYAAEQASLKNYEVNMKGGAVMFECLCGNKLEFY